MADISPPNNPATKIESAIDDQDATPKNNGELQSGSKTTVEGPGTPATKGKTEEERRESRERMKTVFIVLAFMVSCLALVLSCFSYFVSQRSATAAERSATAAENSAVNSGKAVVLSQRPWVSVDLSIAEPLVFDSNGARTLLRFTMKNLGHSPAVFVNMHFAALPVQNLQDGLTKRKEICTRIQEWDKGEFSEMILPGGQSEEGRALRIKKADIDKNTTRIPGGPSVVILDVVGCVDYQFTFAKEHHQTEFSFETVVRSFSVNTIDPMQGSYPVENIRFVSSGGSYAD